LGIIKKTTKILFLRGNMLKKLFKKNRGNTETMIDPDEIFLDSENLQNFNRQQFEGRLEKSIPKKNIILLNTLFFLLAIIFGSRLYYLQVQKGEAYLQRSENNTLEKAILFADRGIIYDRNGVELVWNENTESGESFSTRSYLSPGFSHVVGYVSYPSKDKSGNFWKSEFQGKDGLEKQYNDRIKGINGSKIVEMSALGKIYSENTVNAPIRGEDLKTTIDARIGGELYKIIKDVSENYAFTGGIGIIMDIKNGEIITSTSFPEYNSEILSLGKDSAAINTYIHDKRKYFLDRATSGLYTPGSIVKPILAIGALAEGIIDQYKEILSTGSISIPNPYFPKQETVFKDWRVNGWTNMAEAIAVSSDVYFYAIGGGYKDQKGLGIANIEKYSKIFGIGTKTGVDLPDEKNGLIPNPEWKLKNFKGDPWRIGDTYHTAIGQYGYQVTPMEVIRAVGAIANNGTLLTPHFILGDKEMENQISKIDLKKEYFDVAHDGMRQAVTAGTAVSLNVPYVAVAAKTGTAQIGVAKNRVNSSVIGFFPYENPKYAFTVMMESGPSVNSVNASYVMRQLLDWMSINTPEYFNQPTP
jgi:penicillin-binding protein 2